jgi:iron only hydrogenase large subunit-like protein
MNCYYPIYTEKADCQDCYKCVRVCPTKAIRVVDGKASVIEQRCILCGECVQVCPVGAKRVRNDVERAKRLLQIHDKVIVSLAPSFVAEFKLAAPNQMIRALKKLGFYGVSETALGAEEVSAHMAKIMREKSGKLLISSACPTVVQLVQKYYPQYCEYLADLYSPVLAHCIQLREEYGSDIVIVFIGPCIAKKIEADHYSKLLDLVLTFNDLREWLNAEGIDPRRLETEASDHFIPRNAREGALYPIASGMIGSIHADCPVSDLSYISFSGMTEIRGVLDHLADTKNDHGIMLELLACKGGCVNGPCVEKRNEMLQKRIDVIQYARYEKEEIPGIPSLNISNRYHFDSLPAKDYSQDDIRRTLHGIGKYSLQDELNCGGCGYDSCRDFVRAILDGKAEKDMCVSYMRQLAHKKANALLKTMPSAVVIVDSNMQVVECNRNFSRMLGEESELVYNARPGMAGAYLEKLIPFADYFKTVLESGEDILDKDIHYNNQILHGSIFNIEKGRIVGGIFQDITAPAMHKSQIIAKTRSVIQKNLATVQQIAYLLGENASETEATLDSIIQSFSANSIRKEK